MNTFEVALRTGTLPDKIEELVPMMFAGQAAVKFMSAKLKLVSDKNLNDPMGTLDKQRKQTVEDGQCMGEMLLKIMGRIGELSEEIPQEHAQKNDHGRFSKPSMEPNKHKKLGLKDKQQLQQAQFIKNHPDIVQETIADCKKTDDIPNMLAVHQKFKIKKMEERERERKAKAKEEGRDEKMSLEIRLEEQVYINALEQFLTIVPKVPPKDWSELGFTKARALANLIIKRLEVFNESQIESNSK